MKPWRLSIKQGLVLIEFADNTLITVDELKGVFAELNSEPDKYRFTNVVWDLRNITPDENLNFESFSKLVDYFKTQRQSHWKHDKTALVVSSQVAYGLSRIFGALAEDTLDYELKIFVNELQAALDWAQSKS
jgi:hypothetical protein